MYEYYFRTMRDLRVENTGEAVDRRVPREAKKDGPQTEGLILMYRVKRSCAQLSLTLPTRTVWSKEEGEPTNGRTNYLKP